jgi:hypothetical protein
LKGISFSLFVKAALAQQKLLAATEGGGGVKAAAASVFMLHLPPLRF